MREGSSVVTHDAARMARMKHPSKGLGEIIRWIDYTRDVLQNYFANVFPILNGKRVNINVTGTLSRNLSVDHLDNRHVVFQDGSRATRICLQEKRERDAL